MTTGTAGMSILLIVIMHHGRSVDWPCRLMDAWAHLRGHISHIRAQRHLLILKIIILNCTSAAKQLIVLVLDGLNRRPADRGCDLLCYQVLASCRLAPLHPFYMYLIKKYPVVSGEEEKRRPKGKGTPLNRAKHTARDGGRLGTRWVRGLSKTT